MGRDGSVTITITKLSAFGAMASGVFIDPPSASTPPPQWRRQPLSSKIPPPRATGSARTVPTVTISQAPPPICPATQQSRCQASGPQPRSRQPTRGRSKLPVAQAAKPPSWNSNNEFHRDVNITDGQAHEVGVYALDWEKWNRFEQVQVKDATTGVVLDTETIGKFQQGTYLEWVVTGSVLITVTRMNNSQPAISGIFFDPAPAVPRPTSPRTPPRKATGSAPTAHKDRTSWVAPPATRPTPSCSLPAKRRRPGPLPPATRGLSRLQSVVAESPPRGLRPRR